MQRYDLVEVTYQVYYTDHEMEKYDEGEWVKYDDAAARIAELEADRDRLAVIVERFVSISVSEDHEFQDVEKEKEID